MNGFTAHGAPQKQCSFALRAAKALMPSLLLTVFNVHCTEN